MKRQVGVTTVSCALAALLALISLQGCTFGKQSAGKYFLYRAQDAAEIFEFGVTYSKTPQIAIYADGVSVAPGGYGNVDGYFIGIGGGQVGMTRFYEKSLGLFLWGNETVGWGEYDVYDPNTLNNQGVGIGGLVAGPRPTSPNYMPACAHYFHLGWVGVVANIRYLEVFDFMSGWFFLDLSGDDGVRWGHWPWQRPPGE